MTGTWGQTAMSRRPPPLLSENAPRPPPPPHAANQSKSRTEGGASHAACAACGSDPLLSPSSIGMAAAHPPCRLRASSARSALLQVALYVSPGAASSGMPKSLSRASKSASTRRNSAASQPSASRRRSSSTSAWPSWLWWRYARSCVGCGSPPKVAWNRHTLGFHRSVTPTKAMRPTRSSARCRWSHRSARSRAEAHAFSGRR
mmetsp:Transcript_1725/g.6743  ORF Transcript_1725/g.6743 Transcript_1725/m.6743 type:complete len:203 (+) Transcript_1725:2828-3436(+)